jgi:hypothetical protein
VLVVVLAACGGGGDAAEELPDTVEELTSTTPPEGRGLVDWQEASRSICNEFNPRTETAAEEVVAAGSPEAALTEFTQLVQLVLEYTNRLRSLPVPTERTRQVEAINDRLDRGAKAISALRRNVESGNYGGFVSQHGILTNYANTDDLYISLDVPECAPAAE